MRRTILAVALAAITLPLATPALADPPPWAPAHGERDHGRDRGPDHGRGYDDGDFRDRGRGPRNIYDARGRYYEPHQLRRDDRIWRGRDGRYYCHRDNGTTGLVVGAAIGGLIGNQLAGRGDRTLGTLLGAAGGGLLGREIDRGNVRCR
ncbi:hypothetical protein Y88_1332 [Novosphingobium nitrogenifigens DSM 19370]|uniref:17 kDa surface antigen n=1 Tax=Novosphingobium nitrogenifigens DSM 19370 TaxID=983920 RepID=F1Z7V5_9SPHN|nr:glycine zipper 2TM domain-containing protein [Novosphingobium nitrogenifigens]EGD59270.1 hypothetical protein Y88_1332 [Novosphingobium nitrogenifigens DSM 19370]